MQCIGVTFQPCNTPTTLHVRAGALYDNITQLPDLPCMVDVEEWMSEDEKDEEDEEEEHMVRAILRRPGNAKDPEFAENLEDAHALYRMITGD